jgi:hypothetical protein
MFIVTGLVFLTGSQFYDLGTLSDMESGYFPAIISSILILLGILNYIKDFKQKELIDLKLGKPILLFFIIICTSLIAKYAGMILATVFVITATSRLHKDYSIKNCIITNILGISLILLLKFTLLQAMMIW